MIEVSKKRFYESIGPLNVTTKAEDVRPYNVNVKLKSGGELIGRTLGSKYFIKLAYMSEDPVEDPNAEVKCEDCSGTNIDGTDGRCMDCGALEQI